MQRAIGSGDQYVRRPHPVFDRGGADTDLGLAPWELGGVEPAFDVPREALCLLEGAVKQGHDESAPAEARAEVHATSPVEEDTRQRLDPVLGRLGGEKGSVRPMLAEFHHHDRHPGWPESCVIEGVRRVGTAKVAALETNLSRRGPC